MLKKTIKFIYFSIIILLLPSCSILESLSLSDTNSPINNKNKSEGTKEVKECIKDAINNFSYYSHNPSLNELFKDYIEKEKKKNPINFSNESLAFSILQAESDPHIVSETSKISTIIKVNGKLYTSKFTSDNKPNFSLYLSYLVEKLSKNDHKYNIDFLNNFDKNFTDNLPASKSLEDYIEQNKSNFLKNDQYAKLFFRGIAPIKKGESFPRESFKISKTLLKSSLLEDNNQNLYPAENFYMCNFNSKSKKKEYTDTSLNVFSTTFGIYKNKNNFFLTTISSVPNIENHYSKSNLGLNSKIKVNSVICLNDKFAVISRDKHFSREILVENFLNYPESSNLDPSYYYNKSRILNLRLPTRTVSEIFGKGAPKSTSGNKVNWLSKLGDIEVINLINGEIKVDPRRGIEVCN